MKITSLLRDSRVASGILIVISLWIFSANLWAGRNVVVDDAYIEFRYVHNLVQGHGFVWNPGEAPFEISTNILFTIVLAPVLYFHGNPIIFSHLLGILSVLVVAYLLYVLSKESGYSHPVALLLSCLYLSFPTIGFHALSGLQTSFFSAMLFLFFFCTVRARQEQTKPKLIFMIVAYGLVIAARTEAAFFAALFLAFAFFLRHPQLPPVKKPFLKASFACLLVAAAFFSWKLFYFGSLITGPMLIKLKSKCFMPGQVEFLLFIFRHNVYFLLAVLGLFLFFPRKPLQVFSLFLATIILLVYIFVCQLMGMEGRFFVPAIPYLLLIMGGTFEVFFSHILSKPFKFLCAVLCIILINCTTIGSPGNSLELRKYIFQSKGSLKKTWTDVDIEIGKQLGKLKDASRIVVASEDIGAIGYYSEVYNIDLVGIANPFIARSANPKQYNDRVFSYNPDMFILRVDPSTLEKKRGFDEVLCTSCCAWGPLERFGSSFCMDLRFREYVAIGFIPDADENYVWGFWVRKSSQRFDEIKEVLGELVMQYTSPYDRG